jgi:hypothetical protein
MSEQNDATAQPNTDTENYNNLKQSIDILTNEVKELRDEIESIGAKVKTETQITKMIKNELSIYTPTDQMQQIIAGAVGGVNRTMHQFTEQVGKDVGAIRNTFNLFTNKVETVIDNMRHDVDTNERRLNNQQQTIAAFRANQELLLQGNKEIKLLISGDKDSLLTQQEMMKQEARRMAADHNQMRDELREMTKLYGNIGNTTRENNRIINQILTREQDRQEKHDAMIAQLKQSAWYVASRGIAWAFTTGAVGTALVAIGQAMIGK